MIARFLRKELTTEEEEELTTWKNESERNRLLFEELTDEKNIEKARQLFTIVEERKEESFDSLKEQLKEETPVVPPRKINTALKWMIAAVIFIVLITGAVMFITGRQHLNKTHKDITIKARDVAPGGYKAVLKLSDGSLVKLNEQKNGLIRKEAGALINKTAEGEIQYEEIDAVLTDIPLNTISTPRGGQYIIVLPDGTKAWLNASSSLKYPVSFKKGRFVEVTGEVFFEVKKDKAPFIVYVKETIIEVLGTLFNVNAYHVEKTSLLSGSLRLNDDKLLKPGEQAITDKGTRIIKLEYPEDIVAWKNGYFRFTQENINGIMDQLGRWYNIDVSFESDPTQLRFTATAKRTENISSILKNIEQGGQIHFKIEGDKVTVMR